MKTPKVIVLVNPWAIGDVVMMLPLAGAIRRHWPEVKLHFAGRQPDITKACEFFDSVIDSEAMIADPDMLKRLGTDVYLNPFSDELIARVGFRARVPIRVGNLLRRRTIAFCNRFVAYGVARNGHMMDFSMRHVQALGVKPYPLPTGHRELFGLTRVPPAPDHLQKLIDPARFNLILHPKSGGSAHEWPLQHLLELARTLHRSGDFKLFLTGNEKERQTVEQECPGLLQEGLATDLMATLTRGELLSFINAADGLLGNSTGPLHMAGALGKHALGVYPTRPGMDPETWRPLGPRAKALSGPGRCPLRQCTKQIGPPCACTIAITPGEVFESLVKPALEQHRAEKRGSVGVPA